MQLESLAKAYILTHGVQFTPSALQHARDVNAKRQNMVYNAPASTAPAKFAKRANVMDVAAGNGSAVDRPQELFITGDDGYVVCVSAVAPVPGRASAIADYQDGRLILSTPAHPHIGREIAGAEYVPQPAYYDRRTASGMPVH